MFSYSLLWTYLHWVNWAELVLGFPVPFFRSHAPQGTLCVGYGRQKGSSSQVVFRLRRAVQGLVLLYLTHIFADLLAYLVGLGHSQAHSSFIFHQIFILCKSWAPVSLTCHLIIKIGDWETSAYSSSSSWVPVCPFCPPFYIHLSFLKVHPVLQTQN